MAHTISSLENGMRNDAWVSEEEEEGKRELREEEGGGRRERGGGEEKNYNSNEGEGTRWGKCAEWDTFSVAWLPEVRSWCKSPGHPE